MDLSQMQTERDVWVARNFPGDGIEDSIFGAVEELGENHLARHLAQTVISRDCSGLVMKIVATRVQKSDPIAGVSKHPLHQVVFWPP